MSDCLGPQPINAPTKNGNFVAGCKRAPMGARSALRNWGLRNWGLGLADSSNSVSFAAKNTSLMKIQLERGGDLESRGNHIHSSCAPSSRWLSVLNHSQSTDRTL